LFDAFSVEIIALYVTCEYVCVCVCVCTQTYTYTHTHTHHTHRHTHTHGCLLHLIEQIFVVTRQRVHSLRFELYQ
jgi:hypothetical protein